MSRHRRQQRRRMRRGLFWMHGKELVVRRHAGEQIRIVRNAAWGDDYLVKCHRGPIGRHYVPWCETLAGKGSRVVEWPTDADRKFARENIQPLSAESLNSPLMQMLPRAGAVATP